MYKTVLSYLSQPAFTIVELLIVVVVIAILAAITIVSYNGITGQAKEATLKSELSTANKKLQMEKVKNGSFPQDIYQVPDLKFSDSTSPQYTTSNNNSNYCLTAISSQLPNKPYSMDQDGNIKQEACPNTSSTIAGTMQTFTPTQCSALTTFTGANESAVIALTDTRGGITRTYQVAKLADNKCWMLNNLKLGSTTATTQLTSQDTNLNNKTSFTLPQIETTADSTDYNNPKLYGPVPGDTGSGATNYGYLYNWSATTAGESRTSHPRTAGNAPNDICPKGWRLPTGGNWNATTNEFSNLNARMAGLAGVTDANYTSSNFYSATRAVNWQNTGPFKGVLSGAVGFSVMGVKYVHQGSNGNLWSSGAHPSSDSVAFYARFHATYVGPGHVNDYRDYGFGVRCLLN